MNQFALYTVLAAVILNSPPLIQAVIKVNDELSLDSLTARHNVFVLSGQENSGFLEEYETLLRKNNIVLAEFSCDKDDYPCQTLHYNSYPYFFIHNHEPAKIYVRRPFSENVNDLLFYLLLKARPVVKIAEDDENLAFLISQSQVSVVFYGELNLQEYTEYSKAFGNILFISTLTKANSLDGTITIFRDYGKFRLNHAPTTSYLEFTNFINMNCRSLLRIVDDGSLSYQMKLLDASIPVLKCKVSKSHFESLKTMVSHVALILIGKIQILIAQVDFSEYNIPIEMVTPASFTTQNLGPRRRFYTLNEEQLSVLSILDFVTEILESKFDEDTSNYKSEEIPADQKDAAMELVGDTFEKVAFDNTKDVLVCFYASWSTPWKKFKEEYERLAVMLNHNNSIIVSKIVFTLNFVDAFDFKGYPTIFFWPAKNKSRITYRDYRNIEGLIEFLRMYASNPFTVSNEYIE